MDSLKPLDPKTVVSIKVTDIVGTTAVLDIRLRGEKNWMFFNRIRVSVLDTVNILDGLSADEVDHDSAHYQYEELVRYDKEQS